MSIELALDKIDEALNDSGLRGIVSTENGRMFSMGPSLKAPGFKIVVTAEGEGSVLALRSVPTVVLPPDMRPEMLAMANSWHGEFRWPRVIIDEVGDGLSFVTDHHVPGMEVLPAGLVAIHISLMIGTTRDFWERCSMRPDPAAGLIEGLTQMLGEAAEEGSG